MPAAPGERCSQGDAGCLAREMKDTQGEMDGGVPGVDTERGAGPVARGLHPLYGSRGRSAARPPPRSRTVLPGGATAGARPGPARPGGGPQPVPRWRGVGVRAGEGGSGDLRCGRTERESSISSSGWAERKKTYLQQKAGLRNSAALLGQRKLSLK